ncbi:hypothetical protein M422DRAFT_252076 [Sphaerobolus stellatus SS14]|uniref:Meiotically up-regulated protein Msb1/Mug8 domain-containing protein n=1 Tax=Sphaerobolus stellatus (strain SS14) TaxID=990650 RepID=A0A0C9W0Q4_SPHS4|nr:hypothetical protein M422DRAFT_252076 [Sphaerobolus stellatus SS14]
MPSLFARARTSSTPNKAKQETNGGVIIDEFGRVTSRGSITNSTPSKKDKKKAEKAAARQRTTSAGPAAQHEGLDIQSLPDGSFLPFAWPVKQEAGEEPVKLKSYGYLSYQCDVTLGIEEVSRLVDVIAKELSERGLTTPLLFSNQALDISRTRIHRLIDTFLATCPSYLHQTNSSADMKWREEARFAGPHELSMTLRWGLARIVRIYSGQETRGILAWEHYLRWRESEQAASYPQAFFHTFLPFLPAQIQPLLMSILSLLSRLTTHATSSGLTPATLAALFGPLLFGLGSSALPFHHTYGAYLRCSHATEHLLLSYVRAQPGPLPSRLADWIRGYPSMLPAANRLDKARPGARIMRLNTVKRNIRLYSTDLVRTAASWDLGSSKEWMRVVGPPHMKLVPRYSDEYRKRMDLPPSFGPETGLESVRISVTGKDQDDSRGKEEESRFRSLTDLKWGEFENLGFGGGGGSTEKRLQFDLNEGARNTRNDKRTTLTWSDFSTSGFTRTDAPLSATLQFSAPVESTITQWPQKSADIQNKLKKTQKSLPQFTWDTTPNLGGEEAVEAGFVDCFCDLLYGSAWVDRREGTFRDCNWAVVEYKSMPQSRPTLPPADPRTATSLWLYEEFVPAEYRAQLTAPKRKIIPFPSFIRTGAHPAHHASTAPSRGSAAARIPNARELEFEGLLNGNTVTKVLSLGGERDRVASGMSGGMAISSPLYVGAASSSTSTNPPPTSSVGVSAATRLNASAFQPQAQATSHPSAKNNSTDKGHPALPPALNLNTKTQATTAIPSTPTQPGQPSTPNQASAPPPASAPSTSTPTLPPTPSHASKRSSFLPPLPGRSTLTRKGLAPAEYDATLEFETRTMRMGSDEEEGSDDGKRTNGKGKGRKEKERDEDAWVDILVGSQRRMDGQAAVMRGTAGGGKGRGTGVGTGAAGIRKRRSAEDVDPQRVHEEIERALREAGPEPVDDLVVPMRGGGGGVGVLDAVDADADVEDEEEEDEDVYGRQSAYHSESASDETETIHSADFEPIPHMRTASTDERASTPTGRAGAISPNPHPRSISPNPHPPAMLNPHAIPSEAPPKPPSKLPGKGVNSLIEMYRERDASSSASSSPANVRINTVAGTLGASRLPVRSTSLVPTSPNPSNGKSSLPLPPLPSNAASTTRSASPLLSKSKASSLPIPTSLLPGGGARSLSPSPAPSSPLPQPPHPVPVSQFDDSDNEDANANETETETGSLDGDLESYLNRHVTVNPATPRYVHGAPLHNVMEAEEEEEEMLRRASMMSA